MVLRDTVLRQVASEKMEKEIGFSAAPYPGDDLNQPVVSSVRQLAQMLISFDVHSSFTEKFTSSDVYFSSFYRIYAFSVKGHRQFSSFSVFPSSFRHAQSEAAPLSGTSRGRRFS